MGLAGIGLGLTVLSLLIWVGLIVFWGQFWRADQRLEAGDQLPENKSTREDFTHPPIHPSTHPRSICAIIPARNEADLLPITVRSLLRQTYPGQFSIILVDDQSTDGTGEAAQQAAEMVGQADRLTVISGQPLPAGWTGKLWAMEQGVRHAQQRPSPPDYFLFTDADIEHSPTNLQQLADKAEQNHLDLASLMVLLRCQSFWEKLLIPAFVFFFQLLYPFPWVNNPAKKTAAAAGGCILIRRQALDRIGGIQVLRNALIDDCSLAAAVKSTHPPIHPSTHPPSGKIWLGLTQSTRSLRPYPSLQTIWDMVARTAYTQLGYSPLLLLGTVLGMGLVYLVSPVGAVWGVIAGDWGVAIAGLAGWLLMALAYWPTLRLYRCSPLLAFCLPAISFLYTLMTLDSALRHWRGQGGAWKGRVYAEVSTDE
ncbi:MAG: glycosyltransferase [Leptolyngbyaceae cyanobacterium MO_188.B28]|nr:glycosyltransferase [Leptolyngbyaceae cyanobacterium MO_188.B28]